MKHIKLFEDYSDSELKALIGDLADVGLAKKWRVKGQIFTIIPSDEWPEEWETQIVKAFIVEVPAETEEGAYLAAFEKIKSGDFAQEGGDSTGGILSVVPEVKRILSKDNIIKCANGEADRQPMEMKDLKGKPHQDGKLRWLMGVDLKGPTEEAILKDVERYGQLNPDVKAHVEEAVGWNLVASEI